MCGLMAGTGKLNRDVIMSLCCYNVTRGKDSAGIGWVRGKGSDIAKIAQHPLTAFPVTLKGSIYRAATSGAMIGHTRAATQGAATSANAHPFLVDGIAYAHNGVIHNDEDFGKYAVDSQSLIHGIKARDFSKYIGSIALVWLQEGKLYAYRKGNPLFWGKRKAAIYLASERAFLERVGCAKVRELTEGKLYTFHKGTCRAERIPSNRLSSYSGVFETTAVVEYNTFPDNDEGLLLPSSSMALTTLNPDTPTIN